MLSEVGGGGNAPDLQNCYWSIVLPPQLGGPSVLASKAQRWRLCGCRLGGTRYPALCSTSWHQPSRRSRKAPSLSSNTLTLLGEGQERGGQGD